jgi:hypothetical protein
MRLPFFSREGHSVNVGDEKSVRTEAFTNQEEVSSAVQERPTLRQQSDEYKEAFKRFHQMSLDELAVLAQEMGILTPDVSDESGIGEEGNLQEKDEGVSETSTYSEQEKKAFRRAYSKKILHQTQLGKKGKRRWFGRREEAQPVSEQERMFLVKDFIVNAAESALAENFLKEYGFKDWAEMIQKTGVSPEFIQSLTQDENGESVMNLLDISEIEMSEKSWWEKHGSKVTKGVASVIGAGVGIGVSAASGGTVPVLAAIATSVAGLGGGQLSKRTAKYFSYDRKMKEKVGEAGMTRGEMVASEITREFLAQLTAAKGYLDANTRDSDSSADPEEMMKTALEGDKDGYNLLGKITSGFAASAKEKLQAEDSSVKEYWDIAKRSDKIQFWSGLAGSVIAGGLAGFGTAKLEAAQHIQEQLASLRTEGLSLDLDGDKVEHVVKIFTDDKGQEAAHWMLNVADAGRIDETGGVLTTFATSNSELAAGTLGNVQQVFNPGNLDTLLLSQDTTYVAAKALNTQEVIAHITENSDKLFTSVMQSAVLTGVATGGSAFAIAQALDAVSTRVTGKVTTKYQNQARNAAARLGAQASEDGRQEREEAFNEKVSGGKGNDQVSEQANSSNEQKENTTAQPQGGQEQTQVRTEQPEVKPEDTQTPPPTESTQLQKDRQASHEGVIDAEFRDIKEEDVAKGEERKLRIAKFIDKYGREDVEKNKLNFEAAERGSFLWRGIESPNSKVLLVNLESGLTWDGLVEKVTKLFQNEAVGTDGVSLIFAIDGGARELSRLASTSLTSMSSGKGSVKDAISDLKSKLVENTASGVRQFSASTDVINFMTTGGSVQTPELDEWKEYMVDAAEDRGIKNLGGKIQIQS